MRTPLLSLAAVALLSGASAVGGSFNSDFSNPNQTGFTLTSNQAVRPDGVTTFEPVIEGGHLILTYAENSEQGTLILDDLDGGQPIDSFTATFKLQIGPGSGNAADGFAFCFGPDINSASNFGEEGVGNGLIIAFDIYDNGALEAPAIEVKYGGASLAITKLAKADMVTSQFEDVSIQVTRSGTLNLSYKGQVLQSNLVIPEYEPVAGQFAFGARTGGENAAMWLDDLNVTTTVAGAAVAPTISSQPQSQQIAERDNASFSVGFDGSAPLTFRWLKNNVEIGGAAGPTLTLNRVPFTDNNAKIKCEISNSGGTVTSTEATLTVTADTTAPTLVSAEGSLDFTHVMVTFSESVTAATAQTLANYQIPGLTISAAVLNASDDSKVLLTTSKQGEGADFVLTVSNIKDTAVAGNTLAAGSTTAFKSYVLSAKFLTMAVWDNLGGTAVANLTDDARYQAGTPDRNLIIAGNFDSTPAYQADNYGAQVDGFLIPKQSGSYNFYISSDDASELWLSTDETTAKLEKIAEETDCCEGFVEYGTLNDDGATSTTSELITLTAGRRYAIRALVKEGGGGDYVRVAWKLDSDQTAAANLTPIPGEFLATYANPVGASVTIATEPADTTAEQAKTATFSVVVNSSSTAIAYQWKKNGQDIETAIGASFTTPILTLADSGAKYSVTVSIPGASVTSREALLTVQNDATPPKIVSASAVASQSGATFDVGVTFDEALDPVSAGTVANYTLSAGTVSAVKFYAGSPGVVLTASGLTAGSTYTVTVTNVKDVPGNAMTATAKEFKVSGMKWGVVGASQLALGNGVLAVAENGFDVYSDGIGEWGTYDEATFVYEEITGDFDKVVRVEYQDSSSQWARAGLIARDVTNFGVDSDTQATEAGRYQKVHVNPKTTAMGTAGNNSWEGNRRLSTGAATTTAGGGGTPLYPNAWCRLQRVGDVFTIYRSDDGVAWTQLGTTTFADEALDIPPMPAKLFVGPEFSPENGNIPEESGLRGVWVAKFRDYGTYNPVTTPTVGITAAGVITYTGVLQSSATVNGTYAPVAGAVSPYTVPKTGAAMFYRAASQ